VKPAELPGDLHVRRLAQIGVVDAPRELERPLPAALEVAVPRDGGAEGDRTRAEHVELQPVGLRCGGEDGGHPAGVPLQLGHEFGPPREGMGEAAPVALGEAG